MRGTIGPAREWTLALVALSGAVIACEGGALPDAPNAAGRAELRVVRGDLVERAVLTGEIESMASVDLVVPTTRVRHLTVAWMEEDGTEVKAGDRVLEIDNSEFSTGLEERKLAAAQTADELERQAAVNAIQTEDLAFAAERARVTMEKRKLQAEVPIDTYPRRVHQENQLALRRAESAYGKAKDDLAAQKRSAALELKVRRIALEKAQREIRTAELAIAALVLKAPRDGLWVVAEHPWLGRKMQAGDGVRRGMVVGRLPDISSIQVTADLSDVDDGEVEVGMAAECYLDAYPDRPLTGQVRAISSVATETKPQSLRRAMDVKIAVEPVEGVEVRPGMSVKASIARRKHENVLLVPRAALDITREPALAFLSGGGRAEVEVLGCTGHMCAIESGVKEGARLRPAPGGAR